jgi:hypothetical protein
MSKKLNYSRYNKNTLPGQTYKYVDKFGMFLQGQGDGKGDSIGRNYRAYMVYRDPMLVVSVAKLWNVVESDDWGNEVWKGIRHPELADMERKMSRDHFVNSLALFKEAIRDGVATDFVKDKFHGLLNASSIDHMMRRNLSLRLWVKALRGGKRARGAQFWFYILEILTLRLVYIPIARIGNKIAKFTEEVTQAEWKENYQRIDKDDKKSLFWDNAIFPAYARGYALTQMYALEDEFPRLRKKLMKLHGKLVGKTNYAQRLQLNMDVPFDEVEAYEPMMGCRWTGWLSNRNTRGMKVLEGYRKENELDKDWLRYWWNRKKAGEVF